MQKLLFMNQAGADDRKEEALQLPVQQKRD